MLQYQILISNTYLNKAEASFGQLQLVAGPAIPLSDLAKATSESHHGAGGGAGGIEEPCTTTRTAAYFHCLLNATPSSRSLGCLPDALGHTVVYLSHQPSALARNFAVQMLGRLGSFLVEAAACIYACIAGTGV